MRRLSMFAIAAVASLFVSFFLAPAAHAIITGTVKATISHPFIIGNTTLPPGAYDFRMTQSPDTGVMIASNANHTTSVEFMVRPSLDDHTPRHTELQFDRYGKYEVLTHIYEEGMRNGESIVEPSHIVDRLKKQGMKPFHHSEEQSGQ